MNNTRKLESGEMATRTLMLSPGNTLTNAIPNKSKCWKASRTSEPCYGNATRPRCNSLNAHPLHEITMMQDVHVATKGGWFLVNRVRPLEMDIIERMEWSRHFAYIGRYIAYTMIEKVYRLESSINE